jgi:hypothetical protein
VNIVLRSWYIGKIKVFDPFATSRFPEEDRVSLLQQTESTEYIGQAVCSIAADPNAMELSRKVQAVGELLKNIILPMLMEDMFLLLNCNLR